MGITPMLSSSGEGNLAWGETAVNRRDDYLETMLKDLGSAYYQTLQGEASASDVARLVESVRQHQARSEPSGAGREPARAETGGADRHSPHGRWRVIDVMRTDVVTADKSMPYKQVVRLLAENDVTSVPVLSGGGRVLGMVSEADVLRKEERSFSRISAGLPRRTHHEREQAEALTAGEMMTSPAVTIHPDAPLGSAARQMNGHHIRRLPVVNPAGELLGVVSRQDLLSVFLRPDPEIAAEIADALTHLLLDGPVQVAVTVREGVATLTGRLPKTEMIGTVVKMTADIDGVVAVNSRLTAGPAEG